MAIYNADIPVCDNVLASTEFCVKMSYRYLPDTSLYRYRLGSDVEFSEAVARNICEVNLLEISKHFLLFCIIITVPPCMYL